MKIGLIAASEERGMTGMSDLRSAIKRHGHVPCEFLVDRAGVRMGNGKVSVFASADMHGITEEKLDGALLRNIGIVKDYEQLGQRIWTLRSLEICGTYVMNNVMPWLSASDKFSTLVTLSEAGLPVPDTVSSEDFFAGYRATREFKSSVIKPLRSGLGLGVFKVDDPDVAMHIFSYFMNVNKPIYVQRFLEKKGGGDYRIIVVGDKVIGAEFRKGKTWKSNISQGGVPRKAKINGEMSELAIKATKAMGLDFAGIDMVETKDGYYILETNPTVGWSGFKSVTGVDPAEHIVRHLISKLKA